MQIRNYRCVSRVESRPAAEGKVNGNREFGRKLAELRKACNLNQTEVAQKISFECATLFNRDPITNRAVSKWETGDSLPDAQQFISLCGIYGVSDVHRVFRSKECSEDPFYGLNRVGIERANEYISMLRRESELFTSGKNHPYKAADTALRYAGIGRFRRFS